MGERLEVLTVTKRARDRIKSFQARTGGVESAIRITVHPDAPVEGKYELEFVSQEPEDGRDIVVEIEDLVFVLDRGSVALIEGTEIDYKEGMWSSGFSFSNPNRLGVMADPLAANLERVIREEVDPVVAAHGGSVTLVDVRQRRAYIQFGGGCQGCGFAPQTLKEGVVRVLRQALPEIVEVIDVTNHAEGLNPYYRKS